MTISYPVPWPNDTSIQSARFELRSPAALFRSAFTGAAQVVTRPGGQWLLAARLKPMRRTLAAPWIAHFASLRGRFGTFNAYDPHARAPQGAGGGTPLVTGAAQTGLTLATDGWPNATLVLKAGDYFTVGTPKRLYMAVADATSNGSGQVTLDIVPALREAPADNDPLTISNWTIAMRLSDDTAGWDIEEGLFLGLAFSAEEALDL